MKRTISFLSAVLLIATIPAIAQTTDKNLSNEIASTAAEESAENNFLNYYNEFHNESLISDLLNVSAENFTYNENSKPVEVGGAKAALINEGGSVSLRFEVSKRGLYPFSFKYYNVSENDNNFMVELKVNGKLPYAEAGNLSLARTWADKISGEFEKDDTGNDIRPSQYCVDEWNEGYVKDGRGFYDLPYFVFFEIGSYEITITSLNQSIVLESLVLGMKNQIPGYAEYAKDASAFNGDAVVQQAEKMYRKNNSLLYPTYDRTNSAMQPQDAGSLRLNSVGKSTWNYNGDYISWKPDIKEAGWYTISLRIRQNENQGIYSYRTLKINNQIPFKEAEQLSFEYNPKWYIKTLGDEEPYLFYLEPGDVVSLTANCDPMSEILRLINEYNLELNSLYREVISITGTSPDRYRDYMLDDQIPTLETEIKELSGKLNDISKKFQSISGTKGSQASILDYVVGILNEFAYDCNTIPNRLSAFQGILENVGALLNTIGKQPLEVDWLRFSSVKDCVTSANDSWLKQTVFSLCGFAASFTNDYASNTDGKGKQVNVWATVGRDQAKIIKNLVRNNYNSLHDTKINLSVVTGGDVLIKASLAGKGPDVALLAGVPLELAARGALVPLTKYGIDDIKENYIDSIWNSMSYNGEVYALPESLNFYMMFYRKDVLKEYGINPPETWDDFYKAMEELQKNNLKVGIPEINTANYGVSQGISIFSMLLLQNGGKFYNDNLSATMFNTEPAYRAFETWVDLYKLYGNARDFSFYSRFRTGEMPLSLQLYTAYNQVASAAPEIEGLWDFTVIPGTVNENGSIDRSQVGTATGCYMLKSALKNGVDKEAFEFMKWWVSTDIQTQYGKDLEAALGVAGRYNPANIKAIGNIGWTSEEKQHIYDTLNSVVLIPQVPGNYLEQRSLTTAFRSAVSGKSRSRRALTIANKEINDEITRKRKEFNLN